VPNSPRDNYFVQVKKLSEQRAMCAHRAMGILSGIVHMNKALGIEKIPQPTMDMIKQLVSDYDNYSTQMKHTDLLIDLANQKMDEA